MVAVAPVVVSVVRFGFHTQPTALALGFSVPLDPIRAETPVNYDIMGPSGRVIPVRSAVLSADGKTVVLHLRRRLNVHVTYRMEVVGVMPGGLTSTAGVYLDGAGKGVPGSDFFTTISIRNLVASPKPAIRAHTVANAAQRIRTVDAVLALGQSTRFHRTAHQAKHR